MTPAKCLSCGAALPHAAPVTCGYCGARFNSLPAGPGGISPGQMRIKAKGIGSSIFVVFLIVSLMGIGITVAGVVVAGGAVWTVTQQVDKSFPKPTPTKTVVTSSSSTTTTVVAQTTSEGTVAAEAKAEAAKPEVERRYLWDDFSPGLVSRMGNKEVLIGRMRIGEADELFVAAHDAEHTEELWRVGPLGTYSEASSNAHFAQVDDFVFITDGRGKLRAVSLDEGEVEAETELSELVRTMCFAPDHVGLVLADNRKLQATPPQRSGLLSLGRGSDGITTKEVSGFGADCVPTRPGSHQVARHKTPKVEGFSKRGVVVEGELAVASGGKSPGTATPRAVGFDPETLEVRWHRPLFEGDPFETRPNSNHHHAIAGQTYVTIYGRGASEWRLAGFDAKSGTPRWDVGVGNRHIRNLLAGEDYVYVFGSLGVKVHDAKSGEAVGQIGR